MTATALPLTITIGIDPVAGRIGPFVITWHALFLLLGAAVAVEIAVLLARRQDAKLAAGIYGATLWVVLGAVAGARIVYMVEHGAGFSPIALFAAAASGGGLNQWGGVAGGGIALAAWCRSQGVRLSEAIDVWAPAAIAGLAVGRIGDVINGEHCSAPATVPWAVQYVYTTACGAAGHPNTIGYPVHPEVAYEMVVSLVVLALLLPVHQLIKSRLPAGTVGSLYLAAYAAGRLVAGQYRAEPASIFGLGELQLGAAVLIALTGIGLAWIWLARPRPRAGVNGNHDIGLSTFPITGGVD